jgi:Kef-type K+ transport system membrane component KefB
MNILLLLGVFFFLTFALGGLLEKLKIPWIFAALILGLAVSIYFPSYSLADNDTVKFLSNLGLYFLLFIIGFELDLTKIKNLGILIVKTTFLIELFEVVLIGSFIHFVLNTPLFIALLVSLSFATVGEAILLPILEEFKMVKSRLGQLILGIATFDDITELLTIIVIIFLTPILTHKSQTIDATLYYKEFVDFGIITLILLTVFVVFRNLNHSANFKFKQTVTATLPFLFSILFITTGLGSSSYIDFSVIAALFSGVVLRNSLPSGLLKKLEPEVKSITYGLFAPVFFLVVGAETQYQYLVTGFWMILVIITVATFAKISGSLVAGRKELGNKQSIFMGVALGIRFSTSLVILKILLDNMIITNEVYSLMIGTSILAQFVIPFSLSYISKAWSIQALASKSG